MALPETLPFEHHMYKRFFYTVKGFRAPKRGEHYVSGCKGWEMAYRARHDLGTKFLVVEQGRQAKKKVISLWV